MPAAGALPPLPWAFFYLNFGDPVKILLIIIALMFTGVSFDVSASSCTCTAGSAACNPDYTTQAASLAACNAAAAAAGQTACIQYSAFKCPDQKYVGATAVYHPFYPSGCGSFPYIGDDGECLLLDPDAPVVCGDGQIGIYDDQGETHSCLDSTAGPDNCQNVLGIINDVLLCGDDAAQCVAAGGTYGFAGVGDDSYPVCLDNSYVEPVCASGAYIVYDGSTASCQHPDTVSDSICDATKYDCDADGVIDDQNSNGTTDNGIADAGTATSGEGTGVNVGYDAFDIPTAGAGQCDPTSTNYADCIGQGSAGTEELTGGEAAAITATGDAQSNSDLTDYETAIIDGLGDGSVSPVQGDSGLLDTVKGLFAINACQDLTFAFKGEQWGITCSAAEPIRTALGWILAVLTLIYIANMAMQPVGSKV